MNETIGELIEQHAGVLSSDSDSPRLDCQILMSAVTGRGREWLFAHSDVVLACSDRNRFLELVQRRLQGEPVAYLTGSRGFWQRDFKVNEATLIPRPETELLIEILLERFDARSRQVLDLGTGTGAIAISLAEERPDWQLLAVEVDDNAVAIARDNAGDLTNVTVRQGDWLQGIESRFDIIVSNPPYIAEGDPHLEALAYEPRRALVSGADGLDDIRKIIEQADRHLAEGGHLLLEHGYDQQDAIVKLLLGAGMINIETFTDIQGQPRAVLAQTSQGETAS